MKLKRKILALVMALLFLLSTLCSCTGYMDPLGYLKDATLKTFKGTFAGELLALLLEVSEEGMLGVEFGGTDLVQGLPEAAELTVWLDGDERKLAASGSVKLEGITYDAAAYLNENELVLNSSAFLGSSTIGVNFLTLKEDLKTSIFSNNSGTVFSDPTISSASADRVEQAKKNLFKLLAYSEKTIEFADEVAEVFLDELTSYAANTRYKKDGYTHITLDINNDSLARTLRATRARLVKDRSFCKYLNDLASMLDAMTSAKEGVTGTEYSAKVKHFLSNEEDINTLCQQIDDAEPFALQIKAAVKSFGMALEDVSLSFTQGGVSRLEAAVHLAEDELGISLTLDGVARKLSYAVKEDSFRTYRAELSYQRSSADASVELVGELLTSKRDGAYTLTLEKDGQTRTFGGKYDFDREEMMLSVDTASINGEQKQLSLKLTMNAGEAVPVTPTYVNVVTMDVTRYTPIFQRSRKAALLWADWKLRGPKLHDVIGDMLTAVGLPEEIPQSAE